MGENFFVVKIVGINAFSVALTLGFFFPPLFFQLEKMDEKCAEFEEQLQKEQNRTLGRMPHAPDMVTVFHYDLVIRRVHNTF